MLTDAKALKLLSSAIRAGDKIFQETISTCDVKLHWDFLAVQLHVSGTVIQLQELQKSHCPLLNPWIVSLLVPG